MQPRHPIILPGDTRGGVAVKPNSDKVAGASASLRKKMDDVLRGRVQGDKQLARDLIRRYTRDLMRSAHPGASSVKGHSWVQVATRVAGSEIVLDWETLPGENGKHMILGFCPECYWLAPVAAKISDATRPTFVDNQLARIPGNPDADKKFVPFRITNPPFGIHLERHGRRILLSIDEMVCCPDRSRCGWIVRIERGIAHRVNTSSRKQNLVVVSR